MTAKRRHPAASLSELQKNRIVWASVISLFFVGAVFSVAVKPRKAETTQFTPAEFGEVLFSSGKYARAAETLKASYRLDPSPENRFQLMTAQYASGDYAGVLETGYDDESRQSALLRAEALLKLHRYAEAKRIALDLLAENAFDGEAEFVVARSAYALGEKEAAQERLKSAIRSLGPNAGEAWVFRARMAIDGDENALARSAGARALEAGVSEERVEALEIETLIRKGKLDQAARALSSRKIRLQNRFNAAATFDLQGLYLEAELLNARNETVEAARLFELISPWLKHEIRGPLKLAAVNWAAGDHAQAAALLKDYLQETPNDWVSLDLYAAFFAARGDFDAAFDAIQQLLIEKPSLGQFRRFRTELAADAYDRAYATIFEASFDDEGDGLTTAKQFLFGAQRQASAEIEQYVRLAALVRESDKDSAVASASNYSGNNPLEFVLTGAAHLRASKIKNATAMFDRALKVAPDFHQALTHRILADIYTEEYANARKRLTAILDDNPEDISARMLLARVLRVENKTDNAVALLESHENALLATPESALFYADLLQIVDARAQLTSFSDLARRTAPEALSTAVLIKMSGRLSEAAKAYRAALLASPDDGARARDYGRIMQTLGREREAISLLDTLVRRNPAALDALEEMIRLQMHRGDKIEAKASIARLALKDEAGALAISEGSSERPRAVLFTSGAASEKFMLSNPENGDAIYQYAVWRAEAGENAAAHFRVACFWGSEDGCQEARESDS